MFTHILSAAALLASAHSAYAQVGDPTFNGIVARATCYVRNVTACQTAWCEQVARNCQGDLCGTFNLFLKTRQFGFLVDRSPLKIVEVSAAEVGKPLWVKFEVPTKNGTGEGQLTLTPSRLGGGYVTTTTLFVPGAGEPNARSFSLFNYECEADTDQP